MQIADTIQTTGGLIDNTVTEDHFGTGYEFHQYDEPDYQVEKIFDLIEPTVIRYPGGTQTETFFDPSRLPGDPTANTLPAAKPFTNDDTTVVPLEDFLAQDAVQDAKVVIVIPTWRYFDHKTDDIFKDAGAAKDEIQAFVSRVLAGEYGEADILAFEIGNEWFNAKYDWTASEFGEISSSIALWVDEAINASNTNDDPQVWVQTAGRGDRDADGLDGDPYGLDDNVKRTVANGEIDNVEILEEYDDDEQAAVDGFVDHYYMGTQRVDANDDGSKDEDDDPHITALDYTPSIATTRIDTVISDAASAGWGDISDLDFVTTEWNVRADRPGSITGFERLPLFVAHFSDIIESGVDVATIWTTQATGSSNGSLSEQHEDELTPTGYLFRLMKNALVGTQLVDPNDDGVIKKNEYLVTDGETELGYSFTYKSDPSETPERIVIYVASAVDQDIDISSFISDLQTDYEDYHMHATILAYDGPGPAPGDTNPPETVADADAQLIAIDHNTLAADGANVVLAPYELIQIELTFGDGVVLLGDDQNSIKDTLVGSSENDTLFGYGGDDSLDGSAGHVLLDGGGGHDLVRGRDGDDLLRGQDGNDSLLGGPDNDVLFGGEGNDTSKGGSGNDSLSSNEGADRLLGEDGEDTLRGGTGDDDLDGGTGNDSLYAEDGNDLLNGGSDDDLLVGGNGQDTIFGEEGADEIFGNDHADSVSGGTGNDTISGGLGNDDLNGDSNVDVLLGREGNDTIRGGTGSDRIFGGADDDLLSGNSGHDSMEGGSGNDRMFGGDNDDTLEGGLGNDDLNGDSGVDLLLGREGDDTIRGGDHSDRILGGADDDLLSGNSGHDSMEGGSGNDRMFGGDDNDTLEGGTGNDDLNGDDGDDLLLGREGEDTIRGDTGSDRIFGGAEDDLLSGNSGHDSMEGGSGNDRMFGGDDNDTLEGGSGNDVLNGGTGTDILSGGSGADVFVFAGVADSPHGNNRDTITDFEAGTDQIDLSGFGGLSFVTSYSGNGNEVVYNAGLGRLFVSTDSDSAAEFSIDIGVNVGLTEADLIL